MLSSSASKEESLMHNEQDLQYIKLLNLVDEYESLKETIANSMRKGFMDLSKTKYILGPNNVGELQYDYNMKASVEISITEDDHLMSESISGSTDASNWFGMLPPPSLKSAQNSFKSSLDLMMALANKRIEINNLIIVLSDI